MLTKYELFITNEKNCISCAACSSISPKNFNLNGKFSTVSQQPLSQAEISSCLEAVSICPVRIIRMKTL